MTLDLLGHSTTVYDDSKVPAKKILSGGPGQEVRINGLDQWVISPTYKWGTPSKTNMEPKNGGLEDENPFQRGDFQVPC